MSVTLDSLLKSRDVRWQTEQRLLREYPGKVLVVLTVVMPGSVKRDWRSLIVAHAAVEAINDWLQDRNKISDIGNRQKEIIASERVLPGNTELTDVRDLETGFEAYWVISGEPLTVKRELCTIEESHPLGRLFDIDVFGGTQPAVPIPRTAVGMSPRRCLLCEHEARWCMRNHTHTQEEIQQKITDMVTDYQQYNDCKRL